MSLKTLFHTILEAAGGEGSTLGREAREELHKEIETELDDLASRLGRLEEQLPGLQPAAPAQGAQEQEQGQQRQEP